MGKAGATAKTRYRMVLAYDGTAYAGWQVQPTHPTIQGALEKTLGRLTGAHERIQCSGRTDGGVHAQGQVAHFDLAQPARAAALLKGFNALLPPDIRVLSLRRAAVEAGACGTEGACTPSGFSTSAIRKADLTALGILMSLLQAGQVMMVSAISSGASRFWPQYGQSKLMSAIVIPCRQ